MIPLIKLGHNNKMVNMFLGPNFKLPRTTLVHFSSLTTGDKSFLDLNLPLAG